MKHSSISTKVVQFFLTIILLGCAVLCLYPILYVFSVSLSSPEHVVLQDITFYPKGFGLAGYKLVFQNDAIWTAYRNSILYTVFGTVINVVLTVLAAYPLSRKKFVLRRPLSAMITLTMYISGGMIPFFIVVSKLGLYNNPLGVIIPFAVSAWNLVIAKSFFESLPDALEEAAHIDGASHFTVLTKVMLPISKSILAVLTLYYAVGHWNSYFWSMVLLPSRKYQPLQVYLRNILISGMNITGTEVDVGLNRTAQMEQLKYAMVVVTVLPIIFIYPFVQKYFITGMTIGAVKE